MEIVTIAPSNTPVQCVLKTMTLEELITFAMTDTVLTGFRTETLYQIYDDATRAIRFLHKGTQPRVYVDSSSIIGLIQAITKTIRSRENALNN